MIESLSAFVPSAPYLAAEAVFAVILIVAITRKFTPSEASRKKAQDELDVVNDSNRMNQGSTIGYSLKKHRRNRGRHRRKQGESDNSPIKDYSTAPSSVLNKELAHQDQIDVADDLISSKSSHHGEDFDSPGSTKKQLQTYGPRKMRSISSVSTGSKDNTIVTKGESESRTSPKNRIIDLTNFLPEITLESLNDRNKKEEIFPTVEKLLHSTISPVSNATSDLTTPNFREQYSRTSSYDSYSSCLKSRRDSCFSTLTPVYEDLVLGVHNIHSNEGINENLKDSNRLLRKHKRRVNRKKKSQDDHGEPIHLNSRESSPFMIESVAPLVQRRISFDEYISPELILGGSDFSRRQSDFGLPMTDAERISMLIRQKRENIARLERQNFETFLNVQMFQDEIIRSERIIAAGNRNLRSENGSHIAILQRCQSVDGDPFGKIDLSFLDG